MTRIKRKDRPVWHETSLIDTMTGRAYLVAETPVNLLIRLKGTRGILSLPWNVAYFRAATLAAQMKQLNKNNAKRRARAVRRGIFAK